MSTNVIITPVATAAAGTAVAPILPFIAVAGALWLLHRAVAATDEEYGRLLEQSRDGLKQERLMTMQLRTEDLGRVCRSGREMQFSMTRLSPESAKLRTETREPVWVVREPQGVRLVGSAHALRRLAVANTASRSIEYLQGRGFHVKAATKRSGEVFISAAGQGRQAVELVVGNAGEAKVDLQHFAGRECEGVVRGLADAIEGSVVSARPKPEFYAVAPVKVGGVKRA
jgi:hypothetical protein